MIKSMTGYGLANFEDENYSVQVEVKTLNSKFIDLNFKAPRQFSEKENEIRTMVAGILERGKVNILIEFISKKESDLPLLIQEDLFQKYYRKYTQLAKEVGELATTDIFKLALQSPNVCLTNTEKPESGEDWEVVKNVLIQALNDCDDFRMKEGQVLFNRFKENAAILEEGLEEIKVLVPARKHKLKEKIRNHFAEWVQEQSFDENRFEQELIYYFEKLDISEEIVRLDTHLKLFIEVLLLGTSQGKKMGFISQEIGREINTIGSKANDAAMQHLVIKMKDELEKIKEQSLNIL
ncbi:MAG: YicC/YloC family endoribonuclease [Cyclobacteriaceae bacterium]